MNNNGKTHVRGALLLGLCALLPLEGAHAHHSFAMYDRAVTHTFTGKLIRFIPGANHAQLIFELLGQDGAPQLDENGKALACGIETGPSAAIARQGVTVADFPVGTVITVTLNPLRDGKPFGVQAGPVIHCGNSLPMGGCSAETGRVFMPDRD